MRTLIIYDSYFGNTEKIATEIYKTFEKDTAKIINAKDFKPEFLKSIDLLIVGSPTRAFRPTEAIVNMIKGIESLHNVKVTSFDTRVDIEKVNSKILTFFVKMFGYADKPILKLLVKKGGIPVHESMGFYVEDKEGPLTEGELGRARNWTKEIMKKA